MDNFNKIIGSALQFLNLSDITKSLVLIDSANFILCYPLNALPEPYKQTNGNKTTNRRIQI